MHYWSNIGSFITEDIDPIFAQEIRDIKTVVMDEKDTLDEMSSIITKLMSESPSGSKYRVGKVSSFHRNLIRNALHVGGYLSQHKEIKNIFIDFVEDFIEPMKHERWSLQNVDLFFSSASKAFIQLETIREVDRLRLADTFERFMIGLKLCISRLYSIPS